MHQTMEASPVQESGSRKRKSPMSDISLVMKKQALDIAKSLSEEETKVLESILKKDDDECSLDSVNEHSSDKILSALFSIINYPDGWANMGFVSQDLIMYLSHHLHPELLYSRISDDRKYGIISLLVEANKRFFEKPRATNKNVAQAPESTPETSTSETDGTGTSRTETDGAETSRTETDGADTSRTVTDGAETSSSEMKKWTLFQNRFEKIVRRWEVIEIIARKVSAPSQDTVSNLFSLRILYEAIWHVLERLFKMLIKEGLEYVDCRNGIMGPALDVSFATSMINSSNFDNVDELVKEGLLSFFGVPGEYPRIELLQKRKPASPLNSDDGNLSRSGIAWNEKKRLDGIRKKVLNFSLDLILEALKDEHPRCKKWCTVMDYRTKSFFLLTKQVEPNQMETVTAKWPIPNTMLQRLANIYTPSCPTVITKTRAWLLLHAMQSPEFPYSLTDNGVKSIILMNDERFFNVMVTQVLINLSISSIKEYARFIVADTKSSEKLLISLIRQFPWLLETWMDALGRTLLSLCVIHNYVSLPRLLKYKEIKKRIDVENVDGLTPLMIAAGNPELSHLLPFLIKIGSANLLHVTRNSENILHHFATSNNDLGLSLTYNDLINAVKEKGLSQPFFVEMRRREDKSTPLMVALSRENVGVAKLLIELCGARPNTLYGKSQKVKTINAMVYKKRQLSVKALADLGFFPLVDEKLDRGVLIEDEYRAAATGHCSYSSLVNNVSNCGEKLIFNILDYNEQIGGKRILVSEDKKLTFRSEEDTFEILKPIEFERCPICQEELEDDISDMNVGATICGHTFHSHCWYGHDKPWCPYCKSNPTYFITKASLTVHTEPEKAAFEVQDSREYEALDKVHEEGFFSRVTRYRFRWAGNWVDEIYFPSKSIPTIILDPNSQ
nr:MAG: wsv199-like protein [Metapenaeus ensis nimavirus]